MSTTRAAKRAARQSRREAHRRARELHPQHVDPIAELPPLHELQAFAAALGDVDLPDAVDRFVEWLDDRIELDLPGDGPVARAGERLLEVIDGPAIRAVARMLIRQAARVPVVDRRHP